MSIGDVPADIMERLETQTFIRCARCNRPARVVEVSRPRFGATAITARCHGKERTRVVEDQTIEDAPRHLLWWSDDPLVGSRQLDRHGRLPTAK